MKHNLNLIITDQLDELICKKRSKLNFMTDGFELGIYEQTSSCRQLIALVCFGKEVDANAIGDGDMAHHERRTPVS